MRRVPDHRKVSDIAFFVTINLIERRPLFSNDKAAKLVVDSLQFSRVRHDIELYGFVIMPDHIHLIVKVISPITLPQWTGRFKSYTTHELGGQAIWQEGYWSEALDSDKFLEQKLIYIHNNPVRANLASVPQDYEWSSAYDVHHPELPPRIDSYRGDSLVW